MSYGKSSSNDPHDDSFYIDGYFSYCEVFLLFIYSGFMMSERDKFIMILKIRHSFEVEIKIQINARCFINACNYYKSLIKHWIIQFNQL